MTRREILEEQLNQTAITGLVDIIIRLDKGEDKKNVLSDYIVNLN